MKLLILQSGTPVHSVELGASSLTLGRAADNGLILRDPDISGHHAVLFWEDGELRVRDLGSTNGTLLDGSRVSVGAFEVGSVLSIGGLELRLDASSDPVAGLVLRQVGVPVARQVSSGYSLPGHPEIALFEEGERWFLDLGTERRDIALGEPFALGAAEYVLEASAALAPTVPRSGVFPYVLEVDLSAPRAALEAPGLEPAIIRAPARVSLLYVLGGRVGRWVDNDELGRGVWGREWERQGANNLNVLVHRVRKQAESSGFDRRFLDRRPTSMRLAITQAQVA